ncbi:MAG: hypothetical protein JSR28_18065 [Proteobacteria bacterium]|nr:hypothetical protein [Pseudomonadota bacterium]
MGPTVYIIDDLVAAPGKGHELLGLYREKYAPAARARGMVLDREIVAPPLWLDELSNRLLITWTVAGAAGWWGQGVQSRFDPGVAAFWDEAAPLIASRARYFGTAEADIAEVTHV